MSSIEYSYLTAFFLILFGYVVGYVVGRLDLICRVVGGVTGGQIAAPKDFFAQQTAQQKAKIEIDDRKYVGRVETDNLVKTSENSIGKTTLAQDDIHTSVSKLAQLKGR